MYVRTLDQRLTTNDRFIFKSTHNPHSPQTSMSRKPYPLRVLARIFAAIGMATVVYAVTLVGLVFQSKIIAF